MKTIKQAVIGLAQLLKDDPNFWQQKEDTFNKQDMKEIDETKINRIEVINHASNDLPIGRLLTVYKEFGHFDNMEISIQDGGKTLKIFLD